jgi:hypothetical protein
MINQMQEVFVPTFEINLVVRNALGVPTGGRKEFSTNSPDSLFAFWMRHQGKPKRKKKSVEKLPNGEQAKQILTEMYNNDETTEGT